MNQPTPGPGWYPEPSGTPQFRYWDGNQWTEHLSPIAPAPAPGPVASRHRSGLVVAVVAGVLVVALIGTAIAVAVNPDHTDNSVRSPATAHSIVQKVSTIPAAAFDGVGAGRAGPLPVKLPGPLRMKNGKPLVLYMGSEYCPFCATERWAIVAALARFGTWHNVGLTRSAGLPEIYPSTPTFTFHGATYDSRFITFEGVEMRTNQPDPSGTGYTIRDTPTAEQRALMAKYDAPPYADTEGGIPFVDFGDSWLISGSTYSPEVLQGRTYDAIADAMAEPSTALSQGAIGSANLITASICLLTHNRPGNVCAGDAIQSIEANLLAEPSR
jgi:hypothetical protein